MTMPLAARVRPISCAYKGMEGIMAPTPMKSMNWDSSSRASGMATVSRGRPHITGGGGDDRVLWWFDIRTGKVVDDLVGNAKVPARMLDSSLWVSSIYDVRQPDIAQLLVPERFHFWN
jgi:hypothetical protein